ncbi:MAG: hypothetical protein ACHP8B_17700, partial [Terriglobales bacterium]
VDPPAPAPAAVSPSPSTASSFNPWWRIGDFGVLGLWIAVVGFTINYHEKWADEAQAWLIARDLDLRTIWFHELRYEGSPGLWHTILWIAQHAFHARYGALGYIGVVGAAAGVALLIFKAPFPRIIRWPLAFTYFMVYQYAVIARPYTLLPLLAFAAAMLFRDIKHPERMTLALVLLANLSLHGTILAGCLGLAYLIEAVRAWRTLEKGVRTRYQICVAMMALTFLFLFIILKPTPDVEEFAAKKEFGQLPASVQAQQPTRLVKLEAVISGAFFDFWLPSGLFIVLAGWWCFVRRRLLVFALPVVSLIALYCLIHGYAHHHGTVFIAAITALWIAWPEQEEQSGFSLFQRRALQGMTAILLCLCALNIWDAEVAIRHEYLYPYSGAEDAATYLKSVGADRGPIVGFLYGVVGVQPYFDHDILANIPTAYYHHGMPLYGFNLDLDEFRRTNPEYVVAFTEQPQIMMEFGMPMIRAEGYEIVHVSDGYMIYKQGVYVRQVYLILRRTHP